MRIWDIEPERLCRQHLLGEHRELHGLYNILRYNKKGYSEHPETKRWRGKLGALYCRHQHLVKEMTRRGYNHKSPLEPVQSLHMFQDKYINTIEEQEEMLRNKPCDCLL